MGWASSDMVRFHFGLSFKVRQRVAKLKSAYSSLIIGCISLACEGNLKEIIGWESCNVVIFDLGPLLQGHTRVAKLKCAYSL